MNTILPPSDSPLLDIIKTGSISECRNLLESKVDPNTKIYGDFELMHYACYYGNISILKLFNANLRDYDCISILTCINYETDDAIEILKYLNNVGAGDCGACTLYIRDECECAIYPIYFAIQHQNIECVKYLINNGATVYWYDDGDDDEFTPLRTAYKRHFEIENKVKSEKIIDALLDWGVEPFEDSGMFSIGCDGESPIEQAYNSRHPFLYKFMEYIDISTSSDDETILGETLQYFVGKRELLENNIGEKYITNIILDYISANYEYVRQNMNLSCFSLLS